MFSTLGYYLIFGKPLIFYLGILTYLVFLSTAILGYSHYRGRPILSFIWHARLALIALILATIHGFFGLAVYFNF